MLIGVRAHDFEVMEPEALAARLKSESVETIQLAIPKSIPGIASYHDVDDALLARIKTAFEDAGIRLAVLGCYVEPGLLDETARQAQVELFHRGIYCAAALGAGCIATETTAFDAPEDQRRPQFDRMCRSLEAMLKQAEQQHVCVAVEPVAAHTLSSPAWCQKLLQRFAGTSLGFVFDPVNLLSPTNTKEQNTLWRKALDVMGERLCAVHVKDATVENGVFSPCLLGDGIMDYGSTIAPWLRQHAPTISLLREEIHPQTAVQDLAWMRKTFL